MPVVYESSPLSNSREIHLPRTSCGIIERDCKKITACLFLHSGRVLPSDATTISHRPDIYCKYYIYFMTALISTACHVSLVWHSLLALYVISHSSLNAVSLLAINSNTYHLRSNHSRWFYGFSYRPTECHANFIAIFLDFVFTPLYKEKYINYIVNEKCINYTVITNLSFKFKIRFFSNILGQNTRVLSPI